MLDPALLERDLQYLRELVQSDAFEALRRDLPVQLAPGATIVDLDRFIASLQADCTAALAAQLDTARSSVREASARVAHKLVQALHELLDARESELAGWEALTALEADPV